MTSRPKIFMFGRGKRLIVSESAGRFSVAEHYSRIVKPSAAPALKPNLPDYERTVRDFTWVAARALLDGLPGGRGLEHRA